MLDEVSKIAGLAIYTNKGIFVGNADNIVFDVKNRKIDGIFVQDPSPVLVERGVTINIPYRWVQCIGDIIILKTFPEKVRLDPEDMSRSLPK